MKFDEDRIEGGKNFCNKVWNAARFRQMSGPMADNRSLDPILARIQPARLDDDDHALLAALGDTLRVVERGFDEFEFAGATQRLYSFSGTTFATGTSRSRRRACKIRRRRPTSSPCRTS